MNACVCLCGGWVWRNFERVKSKTQMKTEEEKIFLVRFVEKFCGKNL